MQNCPRQLAMQSCVLCSFVRFGSSNQIEREKKTEKNQRLRENRHSFKTGTPQNKDSFIADIPSTRRLLKNRDFLETGTPSKQRFTKNKIL